MMLSSELRAANSEVKERLRQAFSSALQLVPLYLILLITRHLHETELEIQ